MGQFYYGANSVFGQVLTGTAMGDDQRALTGRLGRSVARERDYQSQGETGEMRRHGAFYTLFRSLALMKSLARRMRSGQLLPCVYCRASLGCR